MNPTNKDYFLTYLLQQCHYNGAAKVPCPVDHMSDSKVVHELCETCGTKNYQQFKFSHRTTNIKWGSYKLHV